MPPGCPGRGSWKAGQVDEPRGWAREALTSRPPSALSQTQLKTQNSRIEQLFHKVAQQQRHLEKQQLKIQKLQSQVPDATPHPHPRSWGGRWKLALWVWTENQSGCAASASPDLVSSFCPVQVGLLGPMHLGHGMAKAARKKRLPKMAQLVGPAHNISRLHRECPVLGCPLAILCPGHHTCTCHF